MTTDSEQIQLWKENGRGFHQMSVLMLIGFLVSVGLLLAESVFGWPGIDSMPQEIKPWFEFFHTVAKWSCGLSVLVWAFARLMVRHYIRKLQANRASKSLRKMKTFEPTPLRDVDFMLLTAAQKEDFGKVEIALKKGANVDAASMRTKSPYGFQNANMDSEVSLDGGKTALMYASGNGHAEMVNTLLSAGANVNAATRHGGTALTFAGFNNHVRIAQSLIEQGADVDSSSLDGTTPLIEAARRGNVDMVRYLLGLKADRNVVNSFGETALTATRSETVKLMLLDEEKD